MEEFKQTTQNTQTNRSEVQHIDRIKTTIIPQQKNNPSKWLLPIAALALLALGIWYFNREKKSEPTEPAVQTEQKSDDMNTKPQSTNESSATQSSLNPAAGNTALETDVKTTAVKNFSSTQFGFSLILPDNWVSLETPNSVAFMPAEFKAQLDQNTKNCGDNSDSTPCDLALTGQQFFFQGVFDVSGLVKENGTKVFNGINFTQYKEADPKSPYTIYSTTQNGKTYTFNADKQNLKALETALQTVKFQ